MPAFDPFASTSRQRQLPDLPFAKTQQQAGGGNKGKGKEVLVIDSDDDEEEEYGGGESGSGGEGYAEPGTDEDREALAKLDEELLDLSQQIEELKQLESTLMKDRTSLVSKIQSRRSKPAPMAPAGIKKKQASAVDFHRSDWAWSEEIRILAKERFGIKSFRMCQEPALNATLSGRDIMVVMPTGGGKSLIYQLPALLSDGTTIVITPLISLMQDQTYNLNALDVRAEMLNSATSQEDAREIMKRLVSGGQASTTVKGKGKAKVQTAPKSQADDQREIKLVYVTPEKIDKSKTFVSSLQKMYDAGLLARIIVDEAHCCSSLGHDYRVSYLCLGKLKTLFPNTPITALTATAPNSVVDDTLKILHMPRTISPGDAALPKTTVLFTSPLYRSNLHYSVVPKPKEADATIGALADYILEHHLGATGIIYCLSRTDTEKVSQGINDKSAGKIRCAVYHAGISDVEKLQIHKQWRRKNVHVICATTAFGLGIDAPEVRFVLHHSVTKSIEGYYQESGRAGRDGKDSDCVIFYRSSDSSRLSTLTYESFFTGGREKLYEMLAFAEDLETCRKLQFARYFATTSSKGAFEQGDASDEPCGHCDNCLRDSSTFETVDISLDAYRALRILAVAEQQNGTLTLMQAADLVRGLGGGSFSTQGKKSKGKGSVNVGEQAGGKVTLSREDTESMVLHLLLKGYLREEFYNTAYQTLIYIKTSQRALRFTRLSPEDVESNGVPAALTMTVRNKGKSKAKSKVVKRKASSTLTHVTKKAKGNATVVIDSDSDDDGPELEALEDDQDESFGPDEDEEAAMFEAGDFDVDGNGGFESPNHQVDGDGWEVWGTGAKKVVLRGESSDVEVLD